MLGNDDFGRVDNRPWLLIVVLLVIGVVIAARMGERKTGDKNDPESPSVEKTESVLPSGEEGLEPVEEPILPDPVPESRTDDKKPSMGGYKALLESAIKSEAGGDLVSARNAYLQILKMRVSAEERKNAERKLGALNTRLIFSATPMPEKQEYTIVRGDSIDKIARNNNTTIELVARSNGIKDINRIRVGNKLMLLKAEFEITVSKSANDLVLMMNGEFFKRYSVGTGKEGKTPEGTFVIATKIPEPPWYRDDGKMIPFGDKENILGTRWMSIKATGDTPSAEGYGIHGTWDVGSIGKAESAGCVRMINSDVEELYSLVPVGTRVVIRK